MHTARLVGMDYGYSEALIYIYIYIIFVYFEYFGTCVDIEVEKF